MTRAKGEADKLRDEAKKRLNEAFFYSVSLECVERIVDCIIGAAVLEVADLQESCVPLSDYKQ